MLTASCRVAIAALVVVSILVGCSDSTSPTKQPPTNSNSSTKDKETQTTPEVPITASLMSLAEVNDAIASHKGKVVVVDLWAMW